MQYEHEGGESGRDECPSGGVVVAKVDSERDAGQQTSNHAQRSDHNSFKFAIKVAKVMQTK
ncbi:hypothetical protein T4E_4414 [Trichinella pseudospiralis]|uniref:Uncharacterized protein n=1 Tax=Trichinella pseudospiralis TaxID=6337 RepID=A0A0V0XU45_TRIPS|nr:hypothetical protein T4E_4414 [Trichinella pseudospiralis]